MTRSEPKRETGLYRRFDIIAAPEKPFIMLGSEESAEAAHKLIGHSYTATTWPPTPGAWKWADLTPLIGRKGVLMPDANPDSKHDIACMAGRLAQLGCTLRLTSLNGQPEGWTVRDWTGSGEEFMAWAREHTKDFLPPPAAAPPLAAEENNNNDEISSSPVPLSEDDFASRFARMHGENWRCVKAWGKWYFWDGEAWAEDRTDARVEPMRSLFQAAQEESLARDLTPSSKRAILGRQVPMWSALKLAGTDKRIRAEPELWDGDPWMLGVPGGVIDLKSGKLINAAREQHLTMCCAVQPENSAPKLWLQMLKFWLGDDQDTINFLRRYLGYALTGDNREQCMCFFYGPAQSGKGTIMRAVAGILGSAPQGGGKFASYHYEAPIATFLESRNDRHSTELAAFYKKRLITGEEPAAGAKWDEGKLKWITGGSQITARFIARDNFSFTMSGKIIIGANHRPRLATTDKAIGRRMMVVKFEHPVADEERDNALDAKLRAEWPAILHWLIEGSLEWQQAGLGCPEKIAHSTEQYLEAEDTLGAWMDECCSRSADCEGAALYENYRRWCERNGDNAWSRRSWANALNDRGYRTDKGSKGVRMVRGLSLKLGANL